MLDRTVTILLSVSLTLFVVGFITNTQQTNSTGLKIYGKRTPPVVQRDKIIRGSKYQVQIITTTDKYALQDCVEKNEPSDGFYIGRVQGTRRLVLFCGHRPDLVGQSVTYETNTGI